MGGSAYIYGTGLFYAGERYRTRTRLPLVRPRKLAFLRVAAVAADHRRPFRAADPGTGKKIETAPWSAWILDQHGCGSARRWRVTSRRLLSACEMLFQCCRKKKKHHAAKALGASGC